MFQIVQFHEFYAILRHLTLNDHHCNDFICNFEQTKVLEANNFLVFCKTKYEVINSLIEI